MCASVSLYSSKKGEIDKFLSLFYDTNLNIYNSFKWEKKYANPVELAEIIGIYIDNSDLYNLQMWICIDKDIFISISETNANEIIKYLYERFPY